MAVHEQLEAWRKQQGLTYQALGEALNFSYRYTYYLCNGIKPITDGVRWRFAQRFGMELSEQLLGAGVPVETEAGKDVAVG